MYSIVFIICAVFKGFMLVDAIRRGGCCSNPWYMIIVVVPFGEWFYFFSVTIHDPMFVRFRNELLKFLPQKVEPIEELRDRYSETPSVSNRIVLAQALHDHGLFMKALS